MRDKTAYVLAVAAVVIVLCALCLAWSRQKRAYSPTPPQTAAEHDLDNLPPGTLVSDADGRAPTVRSLPPDPNRFSHVVPRGPTYPTQAMTITTDRTMRGIEMADRLRTSGAVPTIRDVEDSGVPVTSPDGHAGTVE
ncbi:MAG: hypothetical protein ACE5O2_02665 [Armatimonadota bacterium]